MTTTRNCAECDQPLPSEGSSEMVLVVQLLDLRDQLAPLDPSAAKFGFCDHGMKLASLLHVSAHTGERSPGLRRKAKSWIREGHDRLEMWQAVREPTPMTDSPGTLTEQPEASTPYFGEQIAASTSH